MIQLLMRLTQEVADEMAAKILTAQGGDAAVALKITRSTRQLPGPEAVHLLMTASQVPAGPLAAGLVRERRAAARRANSAIISGWRQRA